MIKKIFKYTSYTFFSLFCLGAIGQLISPTRNFSNYSSAQSRSGIEGEKFPISGQANLTSAQNNAVRSATNYLEMTGFSRAGLIHQLSSDAGEGYSVADATVAVDSLTVDWNENAVRSAKQYLEMSGFSCKGLIHQLSSSAGEKYTLAQATYGAHKAGACGPA
ncbi:Ltp family lipoprotein [Gluconobacter oxydans]|uniref:Ltp family lipoprotein n=1 Tax=Gluconobacter oxydans TaxID=442 RepID=UPI0009BA194D|nr:Ltp family lipoprotein [Gluconobacter oxydans]